MTLSFHVRHEVTFDRAKEVLFAVAREETYEHVPQPERQITRLRQIGLMTGNKLTALGKTVFALSDTKPDLWGDLLHFCHYALWQPEKSSENGFTWTYRAFVDHIWSLKNIQINVDSLEPIVSTLINKIEAEAHFDVEETRKAVVSLSWRSLKGVHNWLAGVVPPVIENEMFACRYFCPPELALLAAGWVAQQTEGELGIDFLLTPERREMMCKVCLLDPSALDRLLDWTLPLYPDVMVAGTSAGVYGRFLRFLKWPEMSDLLR
ncbi:MAG: hypothetical protein IAE79_11590 [Anaerolinea sp.]|nr:hypothetical protein [Anaerolinea sp.]